MIDLEVGCFRLLTHAMYSALGLKVHRQYRWLQDALTWDARTKEQWKVQRLGDILQFAWEHVPFYREFWGDHGIEFHRPRSIDELNAYPILTKAMFREHATRFVPDNLRRIRHIRKHTGGTTGSPVHYFLDTEQWSLMQAFHIWGWTNTGYRLGEAAGVLAGGSLLPSAASLRTRFRNFVERRMFLFGVHMDDRLAAEYHARLSTFKPTILYGYPSVIYMFSKALHAQGLKLESVRSVITAAEMLQPHYRTGIEQYLGCKVYNNYGCNDGGLESYECRCGSGLHYNEFQSILQTDSRVTKHPGRLLVTNLWNRSTPFIRYENGDIVDFDSDRCSCGCSLPRITDVVGRTADILTFPNGRSLAGPALTLIFAPLRIDGWQVVQKEPSKLHVRICKDHALTSDETTHIESILSYHAGAGVEVLVERVPQLEVTRAGKLKPIWSEISPAASS